jgi:hypothetical protein
MKQLIGFSVVFCSWAMVIGMALIVWNFFLLACVALALVWTVSVVCLSSREVYEAAVESV